MRSHLGQSCPRRGMRLPECRRWLLRPPYAALVRLAMSLGLCAFLLSVAILSPERPTSWTADGWPGLLAGLTLLCKECDTEGRARSSNCIVAHGWSRPAA